MAGDRQELEDLRRLDELERKASGKAPATTVEEPAKAPDKTISFSQAPSQNLLGAVAEPLLSMGTGMVGKVAGDVAGLGAIPAHAMGMTQKMPQDVQRGVQEAMTFQPRTAAGASPFNPLNAIPAALGQAFGWMGKQAGRGTEALGGKMGLPPTVTGPLASGVKEATEQAPAFLGIKGLPKAAAVTEGGLQSGATRLMQSALKPGVEALEKGQAAPAVQTMLEQGINVSKGGVEKLQERISVLNSRIAQVIDSSPAVIDKQAVGYRLQGLLDKFQKQVTPLSDVKAIQKAWDEFLDHPLLQGNDIPIKVAQEMKQGTYRAIGSKPYGELKGAETEAQKTLARGLKEEIANMAPEVRHLNAEESRLLNTLPMLERRVLREADKNIVGLGWLSFNPERWAVYMADRSSLFKSLIARMLYSGSKNVPSMNIAGPAIGMGAMQQATLPIPQGMAPQQ